MILGVNTVNFVRLSLTSPIILYYTHSRNSAVTSTEFSKLVFLHEELQGEYRRRRQFDYISEWRRLHRRVGSALPANYVTRQLTHFRRVSIDAELSCDEIHGVWFRDGNTTTGVFQNLKSQAGNALSSIDIHKMSSDWIAVNHILTKLYTSYILPVLSHSASAILANLDLLTYVGIWSLSKNLRF
jgi:hypothetical protein